MRFNTFRLSPQGSTRVLRFRALPEHWSTPSGYSPEIGFLQAWFEDDSRSNGSGEKHKTNWGAISGLALSVVISGSCWAGLGLLIARLVR